MLKQLLTYLIVLLVLVSCGFGGSEKPKNLISKKQMVNILIDARLIGSASFANRQKMENQGVKFDTYIFEKYGIDSLQFAQSNNYYAYHLKDYEDIYTKVIDSLEKLNKQLKALKEKEEKEAKKRETDSINALKTKDSLGVEVKKDTLKTNKLRTNRIDDKEGVLINPVSSKDHQSRK